MVRFHKPDVYRTIRSVLANKGCNDIRFEEGILNCHPDGVGFGRARCYFIEYETRMLTKSIRKISAKYGEMIERLELRNARLIIVMPTPQLSWCDELYKEVFEKKYPFLELLWKEELKC